MPKSIDVTAGNQAYASEYNNLRDDAMRLLLNEEDSIRTISGGDVSVDPNKGLAIIAAESGTTDDLDSMNETSGSFDDGDLMVVMADSGDTITIKDGTGGTGNSGFENPYNEDVILKGETKICYRYDSGTGNWVYYFSSQGEQISIQIKFDGGGGPIQDTDYVDIRWRYDFELLATAIYADASGTIRIELWHDTWANFPPTVADEKGNISLSSAQKGEDTALSGWTLTTFLKGEVSRLYVDGDATTIERCTIELLGVRMQ